MVLTRALNKLICRVLIGVFLFAQISVAAYACPALEGMARPSGEPSAMQSEGDAMMPGCDQMDQLDPSAANLCAEHCKLGHQSSDTAPMPSLAASAPALLYLVPEQDLTRGTSAAFQPAQDILPAAAPPPHAVLHCVWRI